MVINVLSQGLGCFSSYGNVIDDILVLANFQFCEFSHVKRLCNVVADVLAKKVKDLLGVRVWLEDLPRDILSPGPTRGCLVEQYEMRFS